MPTIRDVAKLAGVAPITASRVINNSGYASESVRRRVRQAAEQLGYTPNALARSLRSKQTHTLALVLSDITNPFWTTVARGVEDVASEAGFNVILCNTDESETKQTRYLDALIQKQVDGVLLVPASSNSRSIEYLQHQKVPLVLLDRYLPNIKADVVRGDSEEGAYQLVRLLVSLGHHEIALLSGPVGISSADERATGYRRALDEAGLKVSDALIYRGEFTLAGGYQMMQALLKACPTSRPTALFAGNNFIAVGALRALREASLSVPADMSVACFDDLPIYLIVEPFWTVAVQPAYELGRCAAQRLLKRLVEPTIEPEDIVLPVAIIERKSTRSL